MSSDLQNSFEAAAGDVTQLPERPDNHTLLRLYALYKQATEGDVRGKRPGVLDLKGRAKHDAWSSLKGTPSTEAKVAYIDLVDQLRRR